MSQIFPFDSLNARYLTLEKVARKFVVCHQYEELMAASSSVVLGPRGSGKTTLLRMLKKRALDALDKGTAIEWSRRIDYQAVYIPTYKDWSSQLESLGYGLRADQKKILIWSSFSTHVFRCFIETLIDIVHHPWNHQSLQSFELSDQEEAELVGCLCRAWLLEDTVPSLRSLKRALSARLSQIKIVSKRAELTDDSDKASVLAEHDFLFLSFQTSLVEALDILEEMVPGYGSRWALCFDELEIAPDFITEHLIESLRSEDRRLYYKLSMSPFQKILPENVESPTEGHDFDLVTLWFPYKEEGYPFCEKLLTGILKRSDIKERGAIDVLGVSPFDAADGVSKRRNQYYQNSPMHKRFKSLASKDRTFANYLEKHSVDINSFKLENKSDKAKVLRKVTSLVLVRDFFLKESSDKTVKRSRKKLNIYHGSTTVFAMTEGNPRMFHGIIEQMLSKVKNPNGKIPNNIQIGELDKVRHRFRAYLRVLPCKGLERGVLGLLDQIGDYFGEQVNDKAFSPDPVGSFIVDADTPETIQDGLREAIRAGAIFYIPDSDSGMTIRDLKGKRFRLSYLLAPHYRLPPTLLRAVSLMSILKPATRDLFNEG